MSLKKPYYAIKTKKLIPIMNFLVGTTDRFFR